MKTATLLSSSILLGAFALAGSHLEPADDSTAAVAGSYVETTFLERDVAASSALLAEELFFRDPTGEIWGGALAQGVRGREAFLRLQESWNIETISFDVTRHFVSGSHALYAGKLSWRNAGQPEVSDVPFVTMLRVKGGEIVERFDLGDYDAVVPVTPTQGDVLGVEGVAREYMAAYAESAFERVGDLLADAAVFVEVHGDDFGQGQPVEGRSAVLKHLRAAHDDLSDLVLEAPLFFVSLHHAVFVGECSFRIAGERVGAREESVAVAMPLWILLEIRGGEVVEQRDYGGFDHFQACVESARDD